MSLRSTGDNHSVPSPPLMSISPSCSPALPHVTLPSWLQGSISFDSMHPITSLYFLCRLMNVTLGAHNIRKQEKTQQVITVRQAIHHPDYNPKSFSNDIMLLKVGNLPAALAVLGPDFFPSHWDLSLPFFPSRPPD